MLQGTADIDVVGAKAPLVVTPSSEPLSIPKAELLQVAWEVTATDRDAMFPPAHGEARRWIRRAGSFIS